MCSLASPQGRMVLCGDLPTPHSDGCRGNTARNRSYVAAEKTVDAADWH